MKKPLKLQSSFSSIDTSWKDKTPVISTQTVRMVTNLSKTFLQSQSIFIISNRKEMIFFLRRPWSREKKLLIFKSSSKTFTQNTKAISNSVTLCDLFSFIPVIPSDCGFRKGFSAQHCLLVMNEKWRKSIDKWRRGEGGGEFWGTPDWFIWSICLLATWFTCC